MEPATPGLAVTEAEYVCPTCNLVHWKATPIDVACDRHPAHF